MDAKATGELIRSLRLQNNMTQSELAEKLNISDKAISKWETGAGLPDISMIRRLSEIFSVGERQILTGSLDTNERETGNMKRIKFYVCDECGAIYPSTGNAQINCCGRLLTPKEVNKPDDKHKINVSTVEDDYYITFDHPMTKDHYISFAAYTDCDKLFMIKMYPEQDPAIRFHSMRGGRFWYYCANDGLFSADIG